MTASYLALPPDEYAALEADESAAVQFFYGFEDMDAWLARRHSETEEGRRFSLEKDWHALHFLLTGEASLDAPAAPPPLGNVVLGGSPTPFEATYGQVRLLTASEVGEVAESLREVSVEDLKARFDAEAFNRSEIYPNPSPGGWNDEEIASLWVMYPELVAFFERAAQAGHVVLLSTD